MTEVVAIVVHEDGYVGTPPALSTPILGPRHMAGDGTPKTDWCDYCGREINDLRDVGFGTLICDACRESADKAMASGVFTFDELVEFVMLPNARSDSGSPVAVGICYGSFANFKPRNPVTPRRKMWWERDSFWRLPGDGVPSVLRLCASKLKDLLKPSPEARWILKP